MKKPTILITSGEPSGIGIELCLDLVNHLPNKSYNLVILGDIELFKLRAKVFKREVEFISTNLENLNLPLINPAKQLKIWHISCPVHDCLAKLRVENAAYVLEMLDVAIKLTKQEGLIYLVTNPVHKEIINQSGLKFSGHTEYFKAAYQVDKVVMMLANPLLKVALVTTHLPLKEVHLHITKTNLNQTLGVIYAGFNQLYGIRNPRVGVCGLNPHAGEGGYLGIEELTTINPVIQEWQQKGYNISGSFPADTIFNNYQQFDIILAMYHDQGLPVLKFSDFKNGVNITLGLPVIRTSVDHGTAIDIAASGVADSSSLIYAILQAVNFTSTP